METFTPCLFPNYKITNWLEPKVRKGFEHVRVIYQHFKNENLSIQMTVAFNLIQHHLHELRNAIGTILLPFLHKQLFHFVQNSFYVLHAFVFVNLIDLNNNFIRLHGPLFLQSPFIIYFST